MSKTMMPAFDQLPSDLRAALTRLTFNWNADQVMILHRQGYSTRTIIDLLRKMERDKHEADAATGEIMGGQLEGRSKNG